MTDQQHGEAQQKTPEADAVPPGETAGSRARAGDDFRQLHQRFYQFHTAVEQSPVPTAITDAAGRIEFVNRRFLEITGYRRDELIGRVSARLSAAIDPDEANRQRWERLQAGEAWSGVRQARRKGGEPYWASEVITPVKGEAGEVINYVLTREDITEQRRQQNELRLLATAFETGQATLITDAETRIEKVNRAFSDITGYREEEVLGKTPRLFKSGRHDGAFYARLWEELLDSGHWQGEIWNRNKAGDIYPLWQSITAVRDPQGAVRNFVAVFHNITDRKRMEKELEHQATRDHLTGVYNRRAFDAAAREALRYAELVGEPFSLLLFDIDHFKSVNDLHGHDVGDRILQELARRVVRSLRNTDLLARWGGEEFTILLPDTHLQGASTFAERLRRETAEARFQGLSVTISIGITQYLPGDNLDDLLARADDALYRAKAAGRNGVMVNGGTTTRPPT